MSLFTYFVFTKNQRMSYAEIKVQDCYNTCFNGKLRRFLKISFLETKNHALNNKHQGKGCSCAFHDILVVAHVSVKPLGSCMPFKYV